MTDHLDPRLIAWWEEGIEDLDRELGRLCVLCQVRILDPGIIERVLNNDASVCGTQNKSAFAKLRQALMMHYHVRDKAVGVLGETATAEIVAEVVENIRKRLGDKLGGSTSA